MSKTNCINCGASKDVDDIKCPFCGTTYLDLTAIDFDSGKPVVCQFVMPSQFRMGNKNSRVIMSMLAIPQLNTITQTANTIDITGGYGTRIATLTTGYDIDIDVSFKPIERRDTQSIFQLRALKDDK